MYFPEGRHGNLQLNAPVQARPNPQADQQQTAGVNSYWVEAAKSAANFFAAGGTLIGHLSGFSGGLLAAMKCRDFASPRLVPLEKRRPDEAACNRKTARQSSAGSHRIAVGYHD